MSNRSILKTRNQLERITYKINQLKNKYTGQNAVISLSKQSPHAQNIQNHKRREDRDSVLKSQRSSHCEFEEGLQQKQLKMFKKQIYHYIDKCMLLTQKQTKPERDRKENGMMEERLTKVEEELSGIISMNAQLIKKINIMQNSNPNVMQSQKLDQLSQRFDILLGKIEQVGVSSQKYEQIQNRFQRVQEIVDSIEKNNNKYNNNNSNNNDIVNNMRVQLRHIEQRVSMLQVNENSIKQSLTNSYKEKNKKAQILQCKIIQIINSNMKDLKANINEEMNIKIQFQLSNVKDLILQQTQNRNRQLQQMANKIKNSVRDKGSQVNHPHNLHNHNSDDNSQLLQSIDNKLDQFEKDINDAIKQLYDDIQVRITQSNALQQVNQLKAIVADLKNKMTHSSIQTSSIKQETQLKNQINQEMSEQVQKLGSLFEKTIEQMESRMGKLDNNFSYIYEKMSNIEYDNMSFKDKLSSMMKAKEVKEVPTNMITNTNVHANENVNSGVEKAKVNSGGSTLLDTFGRLGYGSMISEIQ